MPGIWMTFFFCLPGAGRYGGLSEECMITLRTPALNAIPTKPMSVALNVGLTSWESGLMQRAPAG